MKIGGFSTSFTDILVICCVLFSIMIKYLLDKFQNEFHVGVKSVIKKEQLKSMCEVIKKYSQRFLESIITGIVFAIIASLLTTSILESNEQRRETKNQIQNISNIYIGCNKSWADESFGTPEFSCVKDDILLCAYISEYYVIQIAFDKGESAQAYLVTSLDCNNKVKIKIEDKTIIDDENLVLGEFSFYDFPRSPVSVMGYVSNGSGRCLYSERYYFNGGGAYYDYYIASLDFGIGVEETKYEMVSKDTIVDEEVSSDINVGAQIITNRKDCCPNTFGVCAADFDIDSTLFSYDWFNSQQLRNKYREH